MARVVHSFQVNYLYDVVCPYSWVGYKMLQLRRERWKQNNISLSFVPVRQRKLHGLAKIDSLFSLVPAKQNYIFRELGTIARQYGIEINRPQDLENIEDAGSMNALLLLNLIRRQRPEFYERAMEIMWTYIWCRNQIALRTPHFFAICREVGFEFRECDDIVSRIQIPSNVSDLMKTTKCAAQTGVFDTPWLEIKYGPDHQLGFSGIFSFPLVDFVLSRPDVFMRWSALERMVETRTDMDIKQTCSVQDCSEID